MQVAGMPTRTLRHAKASVRSHLPAQKITNSTFSRGQMTLLLPKQQCQTTEGIRISDNKNLNSATSYMQTRGHHLSATFIRSCSLSVHTTWCRVSINTPSAQCLAYYLLLLGCQAAISQNSGVLTVGICILYYRRCSSTALLQRFIMGKKLNSDLAGNIETLAQTVPKLSQLISSVSGHNVPNLVKIHSSILGKWMKYHFLGRLPKVDLIILEGEKCPSVRTSVRPSTKSFFDLNEIWYVGRGR